jgi:hypothetical protein
MKFYNNSIPEAHAGYHEALGNCVTLAIKTLLENKHLYQSVTISDDPVKKDFLPRVSGAIKSILESQGVFLRTAGNMRWMIGSDPRLVVSGGGPFPEIGHIIFFAPDVKMYCRHCNRLEPFNIVSVDRPFDKQKYLTSTAGKIEDVFVFSYLCQGCKIFPEVLLVRRTNDKLTLSGRTPMEHVEVPAVVPKDIAKFYSGAVIAYQSGQTLAALFMLRTACEQWSRKWAVPTDKADQAMDKYMASLPDAFKGQFPSLKDIYSQLSADVHSATGSAALFEKMTSNFVEHFDARRLFKLTEPSPQL